MMEEWLKQDHVFIMNDTKKKTHHISLSLSLNQISDAPHVVGRGLIACSVKHVLV
jgi:hypothetical protein